MKSQKELVRVGLLLSGGGAFGMWQAHALLPLLAQPERFDVRYISAASSGALNGAMIAQSINAASNRADGYALAAARLRAFWQMVEDKTALNTLTHGPQTSEWPNLLALRLSDTAATLTQAMMPWARLLFMPDLQLPARHAAANMLRDLFKRGVELDGDRLRHMDGPVRLHVNASECLADGNWRAHLFNGADVTLDVLMASAAVTEQFPSVEIGGTKLADGAYSANPSFAPMQEHADEVDAVITFATFRPMDPALQPMLQADVPVAARKVSKGAFLHETFCEVVHHAETGNGPTQHAVIFFHPAHCDWTARQNTSTQWCGIMREQGERDGTEQLDAQFPHMGLRSTITAQTLRNMAIPAHTGGIILPSSLLKRAG